MRQAVRRFGLAALAIAAQAPAIPTRRLGAPEAEFGEPFTAVTSVRELRDGRVLVADARDKTLQLIDLKAGTASRIGREGDGPGEYGIPQRLVALLADTTLLFDPRNARVMVILPDGTPGPLLRIPELDPATHGGPRAADLNGRFYYEVSRPGVPGDLYESSHVDVIRLDRATRRVDTVATLALPDRLSTGGRVLPGGMVRQFTNKPLAPQDVAAFAADGRVAIVRAKDYRVEWLAPRGARVQGPPTPYEPVRITSAEREAFLASQTRPGNIILRGPAAAAGGPGAPRAAPIPRGSDPFADQPVDWPDHKPPFLAGAAVVAPDGRLWVLKTRPHDRPVPTYDVFDGSGRLVERIALPERTRLAGFGRGVAYLARADEDDLLWLGRYSLQNP